MADCILSHSQAGDKPRIYPEWVSPADAVAQRLAETLGRIAGRVEHWQAVEREKTAALAWCRANGNPHREQSND